MESMFRVAEPVLFSAAPIFSRTSKPVGTLVYDRPLENVCASAEPPVVIEPFRRLRHLATAAIIERAESFTAARAIPSAQLMDVSAVPLLAAVVDQSIMFSPGI